MADVTASWAEYEARIAAAASVADVDALELELFGRKRGVLAAALKDLGELTPEQRRARGQEMNEWKNRLEQAIAARRGSLKGARVSALAAEDPIDLTLDAPAAPCGHLHLIPEFLRTVEDIFGRLGFDVAHGPEVESEDYNFNFLNISADHPARDAQDTFWVSRAEAKVLRTHTTPVQIHYMRSHKPPFRMICPGKVYRNDFDATHSPMFHQFEGLMVDREVSLANMKAVMITAMRELLSQDIEFRFRTSYFPFVEPGLEVDVRWTDDEGHTKEGRWLEVVGCGMVHPIVLKNGGVDPKKWQGFAFGFGVERLIMIKHRIPDLRSFYEGDLRFLRQF